MTQVQVTSISSKGQVVIPSNIRETMGIAIGTKMIIFTDGDNLLLKPIQAPHFETFKKLVKESKQLITKTGFKKTNIQKLIKQVRNENHS
ncbi:AbrB/MazE/SpoVT family DNA-binding domain-containing protein [Candidatus Peregrinibacteria bacterium]|nr:AbrB/MazE/SpoVT family DNA-binding domain-containing protein [Candidatus Peregrinibacteria bacterium]